MHQGAKVLGVSVPASVLLMNIQGFFRIDWFDLLTVQGTLKSFLQHHSLKTSVIWRSVFYYTALTSIDDYWKNHSFDYTDL